jgi:hypothetical protein
MNSRSCSCLCLIGLATNPLYSMQNAQHSTHRSMLLSNRAFPHFPHPAQRIYGTPLSVHLFPVRYRTVPGPFRVPHSMQNRMYAWLPLRFLCTVCISRANLTAGRRRAHSLQASRSRVMPNSLVSAARSVKNWDFGMRS